eukprot:TRINITY_DN22843_c0_g1_i1.p1 TRINITY_DN22843_c0_g1~~TRINITY_DN22843_c0_g1_i1.p1  ORF type:complete len:711 (+),score=178.09 TRINITY_DN22843_c0_g1_i1:71-2203(+)
MPVRKAAVVAAADGTATGAALPGAAPVAGLRTPKTVTTVKKTVARPAAATASLDKPAPKVEARRLSRMSFSARPGAAGKASKIPLSQESTCSGGQRPRGIQAAAAAQLSDSQDTQPDQQSSAAGLQKAQPAAVVKKPKQQKVKVEQLTTSPTPARAVRTASSLQDASPVPKRQRVDHVPVAQAAEPRSAGHGAPGAPAPVQRVPGYVAATQGVRMELELLADVDGVSDLLATFPETITAALFRDRMPQWLGHFDLLQKLLSHAQQEALESARSDTAEAVLQQAREAGISFGRVLQHIVSGAPGCTAKAHTLEEELAKFAKAAEDGHCGLTGSSSGSNSSQLMSAKDASDAAAEIFSAFGGVEGYTAYLRQDIGISGADEPLNGGAAWQRLLAETEVATRLSTVPEEELRLLAINGVRCGGTGVHGHQLLEDVASKLMLRVAFGPLKRRIDYIAARVAWVLRQQKDAVLAEMEALSEGPSARFHSPLYKKHLAIMRSNKIACDLVYTAYDAAAAKVAEQVLRNLQGTLTAGCINPHIMMRPKTEPDMNPGQLKAKVAGTEDGTTGSADKATEAVSPKEEAQRRVKAEMALREGRVPEETSSSCLPSDLRDRVFEPSEVLQTMPSVEQMLKRAFAVLASILANQAFAFTDTAMSDLCRRRVDEAMSGIDFSPEQRRLVSLRHQEALAKLHKAEARLDSVHRCVAALRSAKFN